MDAVASVCFVVVLASITSPAAGQIAEPVEPAAINGIVDPASMIDVDGFSARAAAWAAAQGDHRVAAIVRAEALAAGTKAAEEEARIDAEAESRRVAEEEEEARRQAAEEEARRAAEAEAAAAAAAAATTTTVAVAEEAESAGTDPADNGSAVVPSTGSPTPEQWYALRDCESGNNYRAVSSSGRYRGAYQFSISTWDWLAGSRYPELFGVDPIDASVADQDKMAFALYAVYGNSPWPVCGQHLR